MNTYAILNVFCVVWVWMYETYKVFSICTYDLGSRSFGKFLLNAVNMYFTF